MARFQTVPTEQAAGAADPPLAAMACSPEGIAAIGGTAMAVALLAFLLGGEGGLFGGRDGIPGGALDD